jgi:hypothetical protein
MKNNSLLEYLTFFPIFIGCCYFLSELSVLPLPIVFWDVFISQCYTRLLFVLFW